MNGIFNISYHGQNMERNLIKILLKPSFEKYL